MSEIQLACAESARNGPISFKRAGFRTFRSQASQPGMTRPLHYSPEALAQLDELES